MSNKTMRTLKLCYEGEYFNVQVDERMYSELMDDEDKLEEFTKEAHQFQNPEYATEDEMNQFEDYQLELSQRNNSLNFKWTHKLILLLLDLRLKKENEFARPICKKKALWASIADEINRKAKVNLSGDTCDNKFRNLLGTYKSNKKRYLQGGGLNITWEYYELFDEVMGSKPAFQYAPQCLTDADMDMEEEADEIITLSVQNNIKEETDNDNDERTCKKNTLRKDKSSIDIGEYLYAKQREDRDRRLQKEKKEEARWREKQEMKEREIKALEKLAKAMANKQNDREMRLLREEKEKRWKEKKKLKERKIQALEKLAAALAEHNSPTNS